METAEVDRRVTTTLSGLSISLAGRHRAAVENVNLGLVGQRLPILGEYAIEPIEANWKPRAVTFGIC